MELEKYSIGIGDRFGMEGAAQLRALQGAEALGVAISPVWNKSNREHGIIGTSPEDVRLEAEAAVKACRWGRAYYVDADHIGLTTVGRFLKSSDFFTIDVADFIGRQATEESTAAFMRAMSAFKGTLRIPGTREAFEVTDAVLAEIARKYLFAIEEAGKVYRHIAKEKGPDNFIPEVSLDEADKPQTPADLFFILASLAGEGIPVQTVAPKFTGSFLKGVDYVGNTAQFAREFEDNLAVIAFAVKTFNLPHNLKLSVHSGSDKFSLYGVMHQAIRKFDAGLHLKTAGTTWLEEVIGLAASGGDGLRLAKEVYAGSFGRFEELARPYLTVIDIEKSRLPDPETVGKWESEEYVGALQHCQSHPGFNPHFRQLVHIGYKVAAEMNGRFTGMLERYRSVIETNVTNNLLARHIQPLFIGQNGRSAELKQGNQMKRDATS